MPLVSVGLPVHNGERYLEPAIRSILRQSFTDFELVVCDNASTDGTPGILARAAAEDRRVKVHRNPVNIGAAPNWNRVFELSTGRYFKWIAHDDLHEPDFLARVVEVLERDPCVVLAHTRTRLIDEQGAPLAFDPETGAFRDSAGNGRIGPPPAGRATSPDPVRRFRDILIHTIRCTDGFGLIRSDVLRRTSLHRSYYSSDKALLVELALLGRFHEVPEVLFLKRDHPDTSLALSPEQQRVWIDTSGRTSRWPARRQRYAQILRAIARTPGLTPLQRLRCAGVLAGDVEWGEFVRNRLRPGRASLNRR